MAVQKLYEAENEQGITKFWRRNERLNQIRGGSGGGQRERRVTDFGAEETKYNKILGRKNKVFL